MKRWALLACMCALLWIGCGGGGGGGGPIPAGQGATIRQASITLGTGKFTTYCDGTFDGSIEVVAKYPARPPAPAGGGPPPPSPAGTAVVSAPQAPSPTNVAQVTFDGAQLTFNSDATQFLTLTGKLTNPCASGTLNIVVAVTGAVPGTASGTFTVGAVPMIATGPSPTAEKPLGAFSFVDTLHCCAAGSAALKAAAGSNVNPGVTVAPTTIACPSAPPPSESATITGQLTVPEVDGHVQLTITVGAQTCMLKTTVHHPVP